MKIVKFSPIWPEMLVSTSQNSGALKEKEFREIFETCNAIEENKEQFLLIQEKKMAMKAKALQLKPFVPSGSDFSSALAFFKALGFKENWQTDGLVELQAGEAVFLLQDFHNQEMQNNLMMYLIVEDLDEWYASVQATGVFDEYASAKTKEPTDFPWGVREVHFIDPAGVCWHVAELRSSP